MNISVRLEGGLGDHLCASRFIPAILERHPDSKIFAYSDTENNFFQKECLDILYPHLYESIKVIPDKKYKEFWVDCQFGTDNYYGALENVPSKWVKEMESHDVFYDLHIDSLKFTEYDFDWYRYFKFFPTPALKKDFSKEKYIIFQLHTARSGVKNKSHYLESWYVDGLLDTLSKNFKCKIISAPEVQDEYERFEGRDNIEIIQGPIEEVIDNIKDASLLIGIDSGFRFIGYTFGVPAILYGIWYLKPNYCVPFHQIRWSMFPEQCFPLHHNYKEVTSLASNIMANKAFSFFPETQDFDKDLVRRHYTINEEKSILRKKGDSEKSLHESYS